MVFASEIAKEQGLAFRLALAAANWRLTAIRQKKMNDAWLKSGISDDRDDRLYERSRSLEHLANGLLGEVAALADEWNEMKASGD